MDNEKQIEKRIELPENDTTVDVKIPRDDATISTKETVTTNDNMAILDEDNGKENKIINSSEELESSRKVTKTKRVRFLDEPKTILQVINERNIYDKNNTKLKTIGGGGREKFCDLVNKTIKIFDKDTSFDEEIKCNSTTIPNEETETCNKETKVTDIKINPSEKRKSSLKTNKVPYDKTKRVRFLDDEPDTGPSGQTSIVNYLRVLPAPICVPSFNFHEDFIVYKLAKANVSWKVISKCINRPLRECMGRWLRYLRPMALERWSRERDMQLMHQVRTHSEDGVVRWNVVVNNVNVNVDVCKRRYEYLHNRAAYFRWPLCACESCGVPNTRDNNNAVEENVKMWFRSGLKMLTVLILAAISIWMLLNR